MKDVIEFVGACLLWTLCILLMALWLATLTGCASEEPQTGNRPALTRHPPVKRQIPPPPATVIGWDASAQAFEYIGHLGERVYLSVEACETLGLEPPVQIVPRQAPCGDPIDLDAYGLALFGKKPTVYAKELWRRGIWVDCMFPPPDFDERRDVPNQYMTYYLDRPIEDRKRRRLQLPRNWRQCLALRDKAVEKVRAASEARMNEELHL
jgi:hypothetical protein